MQYSLVTGDVAMDISVSVPLLPLPDLWSALFAVQFMSPPLKVQRPTRPLAVFSFSFCEALILCLIFVSKQNRLAGEENTTATARSKQA
jgi:hypothetical protein